MSKSAEAAGAEAQAGWIPLSIAVGAGAVVILGVLLVAHTHAQVNKVALGSAPKGVTVVAARAAQYRPFRRYVGTIQPWIEAKVGPQLISAYVDTVLVRPGDVVKRGQVLATLDCRDASASSRAVGMQARALQAEQEAIAHEASRIAELKEGGFASPNEIERHAADSASKQASVLETQAKMQRATLEVNDCVLRAPFAGEISARSADPGAFVRPGMAVATLIDRNTVRVSGEVPEGDFQAVAPGIAVRLHVLATDRNLVATIARRSPAADLSTRTIHLEIDVPDPDRSLPVGTTAELIVEVGQALAATEVPLIAASIRGSRATIFTAAAGTAHQAVYGVLGERRGRLFVETKLPAGARVVTEGRALLKDGDAVEAKLEVDAPEPGPIATPTVVAKTAEMPQ